jgi:hypothetical protein
MTNVKPTFGLLRVGSEVSVKGKRFAPLHRVADALSLALKSCSMSLNQFHGTLPDEWGRLSALVTLKLERNNLTGTLLTEC